LQARRDALWLVGERMAQADITVTCAVTFLDGAVALAAAPER
jgi:glutathione S-transferase